MSAVRAQQPPFGARGLGARVEELVGDVQRGDDGDAQRVGARELAGRRAHLLVEVARPARRCTAARDRCGPRSAGRGCRRGPRVKPWGSDASAVQRFSLSICAIIWTTRLRTSSRSSRSVADFGRRAGRFGQPRAHAVELALEPRGLVDRLGALGAKRIDHADELADFFFEPVDRLQISGAPCVPSGSSDEIPCSSSTSLRCSTVERRDDRVDGLLDFASVSVRSACAEGEPQSTGSRDRPARPCPDTDRTRARPRASPARCDRIVPRTSAAGKRSSIDDRQVADDRRMPRQRPDAPLGSLRRCAARRAPRGRARRRRRPPASRPRAAASSGRIWPTRPISRCRPSCDVISRAARPRTNHGQIVGRLGGDRPCAERAGEQLGDALRVEEVHRSGALAPVFGARPGEHPADARASRRAARTTVPDLEQADVVGLAMAVVDRARRAAPAAATAAGPRISRTADSRSRRGRPRRRTARPRLAR